MDRNVLIVVIAAIFSVNLSLCSFVYQDRNLYEGSNCTLRNGTSGVCRMKCSESLRGVSLETSDTCGFMKSEVLFCCPVFESEVDSRVSPPTQTLVPELSVSADSTVQTPVFDPATETNTATQTPTSEPTTSVETPTSEPSVSMQTATPDFVSTDPGVTEDTTAVDPKVTVTTPVSKLEDRVQTPLPDTGSTLTTPVIEPEVTVQTTDSGAETTASTPISDVNPAGQTPVPWDALEAEIKYPTLNRVCRERIEKHRKRLIIENEINIRKEEGIRFYNETQEAYLKIGPNRRAAIKKECENMAKKIGGRLGSMYKSKCKFLLPNIDPALPSPIFPARVNEHPHMTALGWYDEKTEDIEWNCGGTLIHPSYVVTAAHCIFNVGTPPTIARLGDVDLVREFDDEFLFETRITGIYIYYEYKMQQYYNDIAMLKIEPFKFSLDQARPLPACVWTERKIPEKVLMMGYGAPAFGQKHLNKLYQGNLTVLDSVECNKLYDSNADLPDGIIDSQICALDPEGILDTCEGDSGGPLQFSMDDELQTPYLVGLTSFGVLCLDGNPGVYTRLHSYLDWIEAILSEDN